MLENLIAESRDGRVVVAQDILEVNPSEQISLVSTFSKESITANGLNVRKVLICAPGYPGDATETLHTLGRYLAERSDGVVTSVIGYSGVTEKVLFLGIEGLAQDGTIVPEGSFSFMSAADSLDPVIDTASRQFSGAELYLLGMSYGGVYALGHLADSRVRSGVVFVNPVTDVALINADYDKERKGIRGLIEYGVDTKRIRGDAQILYNEQKTALAARFNPVKEKVTAVTAPVYIFQVANDPGFAEAHTADLQKCIRELGGTVRLDREFPRADHNFTDPADRQRLFELMRTEVLRVR